MFSKTALLFHISLYFHNCSLSLAKCVAYFYITRNSTWQSKEIHCLNNSLPSIAVLNTHASDFLVILAWLFLQYLPIALQNGYGYIDDGNTSERSVEYSVATPDSHPRGLGTLE